MTRWVALMGRLPAAGIALLLCAGAAFPQMRGSAPGEFDFYVLSLSWSPGFCATAGEDKAREQCRDGAGLDFVVHGLWPQNQSGFPIDCAPASRNPSRAAVASVKDVYPDEGLARYQWRKHGTCSGKSPTDYFADVRAARDKIVIPSALKQPKEGQTWTALDLERAFVAANPGLRTDMISVACRRDTLQEVRICLSKDLRQFVGCGQVDRSGCRARDISVPPPR